MSKALSKSILLNCPVCGKSFYRPPSDIKNASNNFCSNKCNGLFHYPKNINFFILRKHDSWCKGKTKETDIRLLKISIAMKKSYENGRIAWNKGKTGLYHHSEETKRKISEISKKQTMSDKARKIHRKRMLGEKNINFKHGKCSQMRGFYERQRNLRKKMQGNHTYEEWIKIREATNGWCKGYGRNPHFVGLERLTEDHIIPLKYGGSNFIENIQPLCLSCNSRKNDKIVEYKPYNIGEQVKIVIESKPL
jgi:5-methylcytosine-specific restriction endonuclease McrA